MDGGWPRAAIGEEFERGADASAAAAGAAPTPSAAIGLDADGCVRTWSRAATALTGFEAAEVVGKSIAVLLADDGEAWIDRALEGASERGLWSDTAWHVDADGSRFRGTVTVSIARDGQGDSAGFLYVLEVDGVDEAERARHRYLFEKSPDAIAIHDADGSVLRVNEQTVADLGYSREELRGMNVADVDVGHSLAELQSTWREMETASRVKVESEHRRKDGSTFPVEVWVTKLAIGDETQFLALGRDVTERERTERRLEEERDLFAEGPAVVVDRRATEGWPIAYVSPNVETVFGYDPQTLVEEGRSFTDLVHPRDVGEVETAIGAPESRPGDRFEIDPYRLYAADGTIRWVQETTKVVGRDGGPARYLGYLVDVTDRIERERTLERQRATLKRIQQITENLRPLNRALGRVTTRAEIESVVCEQLAETDTYCLAWYGEFDPVEERITPQSWAGFDDGYLDGIEVTVGDEETARGPAGRAIATGTVQTSRRIDTDPTFEPWRDEAAARGYRSAAAIPVRTEQTVYGVVGLYSNRPNAFDEYERGLLRELGERVGHAIHAAEHRRLLHSDTVVELVFRTSDSRSPFVTASDRFDCRLELEAVIPAAGPTYVCYMDVDGAPPADLTDYLERVDGIERPRVLSADGPSGTIEYVVCTSPVTKLLEYETTVASAVIESGEETIVGEVAPDVSTGAIVEGMRSAYDVELLAKRTTDRSVRSSIGVDEALEDALTDRQREALGLAYHSGFFDSPRLTHGDELTDALGITSSTLYLHVRRATKNLLARLVESGVIE
ncbi:MAG: PAS domain S-box protein [Halanaeroarchaeum sp.]